MRANSEVSIVDSVPVRMAGAAHSETAAPAMMADAHMRLANVGVVGRAGRFRSANARRPAAAASASAPASSPMEG